MHVRGVCASRRLPASSRSTSAGGQVGRQDPAERRAVEGQLLAGPDDHPDGAAALQALHVNGLAIVEDPQVQALAGPLLQLLEERVEVSDFGKLHDTARLRPLDRPPVGRIRLEREVSP